MDDATIRRYIQLSIIPGFGTVSQNRLLKICGSVDACFELSPEALFHMCATAEMHFKLPGKRVGTFVDYRNSTSIMQKAEMILSECYRQHIEIITKNNGRYPKRFDGLPDMPVVLYSIGSLNINQYVRTVGIIGARRCSVEGKRRAIALAEKASAEHAAVISGMAKGIDSYAHTAAVKNDGYTIAVLGSGPDVCYPVEHKKLYDEIAVRGCVLSEYIPGTKPRSYMFPERNRLIAALSDKLMVIDAGSHSGTRTTIDAGRKYEREVTIVSLAL